MESLDQLLLPNCMPDKAGIHVASDTASKCVWDELAKTSPTYAAILATDETTATAQSLTQITDITTHLCSTDVLLDVGCGYGRLAQCLLPQLPLAGYVGIDSSYHMLRLFKRRYMHSDDEQATPALFVNGEINSIPLQSRSVDAVVVSSVFLYNHKTIVAQAMEHISRVVKPGGVILVYASFPRAGTLMGVVGQLRQATLNLMGRPFKHGPVRYYTAREISQLFVGCDQVELVPAGFALLPPTIACLPSSLQTVWRLRIARPLNNFFEQITPRPWHQYFALHINVIAKR